MPYIQPITSATPLLVVKIIDRSTSMADEYDQTGISKAEGTAQIGNRFIYDVIMACNDSGRVRDAVYFSAVAYHDDRIEPAFAGALAAEPFVPASRLAAEPLRLEPMPAIPGEDMPAIDEHPVWIEPCADGGTPMCQAFDAIAGPLALWIGQHPDGPPPVVVHVTDGESTDGNPTAAARHVTEMATSDGNVALFNVQLETRDGPPIVFPSTPDLLQDKDSRTMFEISSVLPEPMARAARAMGAEIQPGARAYIRNGRLREVMLGLLTASRPANR